MTTIKFSYNDAYGAPSRGSLAFMPHRRHAANETEILPKPFTVPLLNGEATVNLQPNSSSWVWIITEYFENQAKSFYTTIPDRDGIIPHTELVHISPSSLPAAYDAVEPAWWAEMRAYKQTVGETLLKSSEALSEAQQAIETGRESVERTQHNASLAKAYSEQSRDYSYEAKDYRDQAEQWRNEAQEQADRAASGPESAAQRAEDAAESAETSANRARGYEDDARNHAAEARASETNAASSASTATERAADARNEANRAESEANRAQTYADELMDGPREYVEQAEQARDDARDYATDAQNHATTAQQAVSDAQEQVQLASDHASTATQQADRAQNIADTIPEFSAVILDNASGTIEPNTVSTIDTYVDQDVVGPAMSVTDGVITFNEAGYYTAVGTMRVSSSTSEGNIRLYLQSVGNVAVESSTGPYPTPALNVSLGAHYFNVGDTLEMRVFHDRVTDLPYGGHVRSSTSLKVHRLN